MSGSIPLPRLQPGKRQRIVKRKAAAVPPAATAKKPKPAVAAQPAKAGVAAVAAAEGAQGNDMLVLSTKL